MRHQLKGDYRIPLTCADRQKLVDGHKLQVSKSYILKVLSEGQCAPKQLSQFLLDGLMRCVGLEDWNDFLRQNPVPEALYAKPQRVKFKKKLKLLVEARMAELKHVAPADTV